MVAVLAATVTAHARQDYVPKSLYAYERVKFRNGFQAILNPRKGATYVSMRLVVGTGSGDFDCTYRELPHLVEHLMFSGTSQYTEAQLEELVTSLGGNWNAMTAWDDTIYEMDIFSGNARQGVEILYQLFTDTQVSEEDLKTARDVVYLEAGGAPSAMRQLMHRTGIMEGSIDKAVRQFIPESRVFCNRIPTTEHIDVEDIDRFRNKYHLPANMMFIAVGDFDAMKLTRMLADTFGSLQGMLPPEQREQLSIDVRPRKRIEYITHLDPVLNSTTYLSVDFQVASEFGRERAATALLAKYLGEKLYEELRVRRGLAYSPAALINDFGDFASLSLEAEVDNGNADEALDVMEALVSRVSEKGIEKADLDRLQKSMLYAFTQRYEGNDSIAQVYASFGKELLEGQALPDYQSDIEAVDGDFVREVAGKRLRTDRALVFIEAPTIGYGQLSAIIVCVATLAGWLGVRRYRCRRRGRVE